MDDQDMDTLGQCVWNLVPGWASSG
jgi:hypothetical protein